MRRISRHRRRRRHRHAAARAAEGRLSGIRWSDIKHAGRSAPRRGVRPGRPADSAQVEKAVAGVDGIVHLGGFSVEGPWETILNANIVGCYNLFEAARRKGVKRVVFASSNHAVGFYPRQRKIGVDAPVRPDSRYGVSKAFGEALGALYAYKHGLRVTCLRIGNVGDAPARQAPAVDLAQAAKTSCSSSASGWSIPNPLRDLLRRVRQRRALVGQYQRAPLRLPAGRQGRGSSRAGAGRAEAAARSGRGMVLRAARSAATNSTPISAEKIGWS